MRTISRRLAGSSLSIAASAMLASCGGGGGSSPAPPTPVPTATPAPTTCASIGRMPARTRSGNSVVPDQLYVTYRSTAGARGIQSAERAIAAVRGLELGSEGGVVRRAITLAPGTDATKAADALRATPGVAGVYPVHTRGLSSNPSPNDTYFNNVNQWYLFKTNVTPGGWTPGTAGAGVSIAVIDTGIDEQNPDLTAKLDVRESVLSGVVSTGAGVLQDRNGHGSNVAGLAGAATNNAAGYAGVGYNARLQGYKIFSDPTSATPCPTANTADEARAIRDAVTNGASVINLSLGDPAFDQAEADAVAVAIAANVTVVAAGGNATGSTPEYPGADAGVIAVGASSVVDATPNVYATIISETVASYSNSGVALVAPGGDPINNDPDTLHWIEGFGTTTATLAADRCNNPNAPFTNCRILFAGTSQASPQVAGTVALMLSYHGGARSLSPATVKALLMTTADNIGAAAARQGAGRLNAGNAVAAAHP